MRVCSNGSDHLMFGRQNIIYTHGGVGMVGVVRNPSYDSHVDTCECLYCLDIKRKVIG